MTEGKEVKYSWTAKKYGYSLSAMEINRQRNILLNTFIQLIKASTKHRNKKTVEAAHRLNTVIISLGDIYITKKPQNIITANIDHLLQELGKEKYMDDLHKVHIADWLPIIADYNTEYKVLTGDSNK